jgi:hypothetical protein
MFVAFGGKLFVFHTYLDMPPYSTNHSVCQRNKFDEVITDSPVIQVSSLGEQLLHTYTRTGCTSINRYDTGTISGILAMGSDIESSWSLCTVLTFHSYWENQFSTGYRDAKGHLNVTASQSAEIVSILSAGTFFGALGAAPIADRIGRRLSLIAACCVFTFGVILQTAATHLPSKDN